MATTRFGAEDGTMLLRDYPGPRGAPTITYVAISPQEKYFDPTARDVARQNKHTVTVEDRQKLEHRYQMEEVFANLKDDDVVYESMLENTESGIAPVRALVKNSVSTCVLVMGSTSSRKKMLFQGDGRADSDEDGVIGWAANKLFELLEEEQKDPDFRGAVVAASFVEIFDETLIDLLNLEAKGLHLMMDPRDGYQVTPLDKVEVKNYDDTMRVLEHGIKNRNSKRFQDGTAADFSSAVFEFHVMQQRVMRIDGGANPGMTQQGGGGGTLAQTVFKTHMADGDDDPVETLISRLVFVEVPCTDDLIESPLELRARHGPYLHRSLLTFVDVCKAMADETMQYYAPFAQSRLTHILQDILGGNFLVLCLACVAPGEPEITLKTLELVSTLGKAAHFPNENHEMLQGLLMKYRTEIGHLHDKATERELLEADSGGRGRMELSEEMEAVRRKLQDELGEAQKERNLAKEDALKIYKVLELLKAKYNSLLDEKAKQAKELIDAEEAKLKIARSLLELKLEISKLQEDFEKEKYDLSSQLLGAKNEVCELEIKLHDAEEQASKSKDDAESARRERDDMQVELSSLHSNFTGLRSKYNEEKNKTVELGAELLSLVNAHEALGKVKSELDSRVLEQQQRLKELETALEKSGAETDRLATAQRQQAKELDELRAEKIKAQLELERATVAFEQSRLQMDKSTADFMRDKDMEVLQTRRNAEEQFRKLQVLNEELERKCQVLEGQIRREYRKVTDLTADLARGEDEARALRKERDALEGDLEAMTRKYRRKVVVLLEKDMGHMAALANPGWHLQQKGGGGRNRGGLMDAALGENAEVPRTAEGAQPGKDNTSKATGSKDAGPEAAAGAAAEDGRSPQKRGSGLLQRGNSRLNSALAAAQQQQDGKQQDGNSNNNSNTNKDNSTQQQQQQGAASSLNDRLEEEHTEYKERRTLVEDLLESYRWREQSLQAQCMALRAQVMDLNHKNKLLFDKCRKLMHLLEDLAPQALQESNITLSQDEDTPLEQALREEGEALRRRLAEADKELSIQQEKNIQLAELYMQALRRLEAHKADMDQRLAKLETENALLKGQPGDLRRLQELQSKQVGTMGPTPASGDDAAQLTLLKQENDHLRKQLRLARGGMPGGPLPPPQVQQPQQQAGPMPPGPVMMMSAGPAAAAPAGGSHPHHHHHHHHHPPHGCTRCHPKCPCTCKGAGTAKASASGSSSSSSSSVAASALMAQLQEAEKRYASLMSKCAMLEEESSSYKQHMKGVVGKYQAEMQRKKAGSFKNQQEDLLRQEPPIPERQPFDEMFRPELS